MLDDHNLGASDYAAIGAKFVIPERFTYYWDAIPNVQFATATFVYPFHFSSSLLSNHKDYTSS